MIIPGLTEGTPSESPAPDPRLTHWVSWDGGFCAWARPLPGDRMLLAVCEDGPDWSEACPGEDWVVAVVDMTTIEPLIESNCAHDELKDKITWTLEAAESKRK